MGKIEEKMEGSAIFTLEFYRHLSHSIPIPTQAPKLRSRRPKGQQTTVSWDSETLPLPTVMGLSSCPKGGENRMET